MASDLDVALQERLQPRPLFAHRRPSLHTQRWLPRTESASRIGFGAPTPPCRRHPRI